MIPPSYVELGEVLCLRQPVDNVRGQGERVPILNGNFIKSAIVLDEP